jgi:hypothetical protein
VLIRNLHLPSGSLLGVLLGFAFFAISAVAQTTAPNEWTWVSGNGAGSSNPINRLGASSWTDHNGNLWLYGGYYYTTNQYCTCTTADLDDLWMFNPSTNQWTFISGLENDGLNTPGSYGALGTPASSNNPGGRDSAVSWTDSSGNLWLFGGSYTSSGYFLNDLWEFNPSTQDWVWMGGSNTLPTNGVAMGASGVYGTLGMPDAANVPGGRKRALSWTDSNGNFWLYGGYGIDSTGTWGDLNDLWKFNPSLGTYGEWAWMGGNNTLPGSNDSLPPVYGTLGSPDAANNPGGREYASGWADKNGNLWLFGGEGSDNTNDTMNWYNDLWKFDPSLGTYGEWAWMSGSSSTSYQSGVYGTLGTPATGNVPGGRYYASSWIDSDGNLWLFGGSGGDADTAGGWFNDLWVFDPSTTLWAWMGGVSGIGSNKWLSPEGYIYGQPGSYGTLNVPGPSNDPGARQTTTTWTDNSSNFWLFGGEGFDGNGNFSFLNDMWVYQPSTGSLPAAAAPTFSEPAGTYTTWQTVTISDATIGTAIYYTIDGSAPTTSSNVYESPITVASTETIKAFAVANLRPNSSIASATYTLNLPIAATPTFSLAAGTYPTAQSVSISDTTTGAAIYYTVDGTTPGVTSNLYSGAFQVPVTETVKAIAVATNYSYSAVASATYTIPPDFSVPVTLPSLTIATGNNAFDTITVTPVNGFTGTVSFSCSGLPTEATCSFSPYTVAGSGSTKITVTATAPNTAAMRRNGFPLLPGSALAVVLCCFGLRKRRHLQMILLVVVSLAGLSLVTSCSSGSSKPSYTPLPNTETVTVTATAGSLSHTTTFTLTVND